MIILIALLLFSIGPRIEKVDKGIKEPIYYSAYNNQYKGPSYVVYKIYKGGGNCSRKGCTFTSNYPHYNFSLSSYDTGHLVPAEDFAYSDRLMKSTFKYYNALPQTPNLNRGSWKKVENQVRKLSQTDSLLVIAGATDYSKDSHGYVPKVFFKVVYSLTSGKCLISGTFTNNDKSKYESKPELTEELPYLKMKGLVNYIDLRR